MNLAACIHDFVLMLSSSRRSRMMTVAVFRRWIEFHRKALGFLPSWEAAEA